MGSSLGGSGGPSHRQDQGCDQPGPGGTPQHTQPGAEPLDPWSLGDPGGEGGVIPAGVPLLCPPLPSWGHLSSGSTALAVTRPSGARNRTRPLGAARAGSWQPCVLEVWTDRVTRLLCSATLLAERHGDRAKAGDRCLAGGLGVRGLRPPAASVGPPAGRACGGRQAPPRAPKSLLCTGVCRGPCVCRAWRCSLCPGSRETSALQTGPAFYVAARIRELRAPGWGGPLYVSGPGPDPWMEGGARVVLAARVSAFVIPQ